nr:hypothetical protein GCM10020185_46980 [Pseudomonas brassicacearum subsp. brassicacearum]
MPRPSLASTRTNAKPVEEVVEAPPKAPYVAPPRFALQLLRAGRCLLLVELPTGEPFQSRDPAYLLLKDMLRAAGLPDSPQIIGEPVRWPLLSRGTMDQGPEAARDFCPGVRFGAPRRRALRVPVADRPAGGEVCRRGGCRSVQS